MMKSIVKCVYRFILSACQITLLVALVLAIIFFGSGGVSAPSDMPGKSFADSPPPLSKNELVSKAHLQQAITHLAEMIGERNITNPGSLEKSRDYIISQLTASGYAPVVQEFVDGGQSYYNIIAIKKGEMSPGEIFVLGAHYDSVAGSKGANDNASGVAALLEIARQLAKKPLKKTIHFVAFTNEEPPYFQTDSMGSVHYANAFHADKQNIVGMIALDTIGYFTDQAGSQKYPYPLNYYFPDTGNFIAFVANRDSSHLLKQTIGSFRTYAAIPSEGGYAPSMLPGIGWSDHWSFWQAGYPAIMVTDTAIFRYPHYHRQSDTPSQVNFDQLTRVTSGLIKSLIRLANS